MVKSVLQVVGATGNPENAEEAGNPENIARDQRRVSTTRFKSLCHNCNIAGVGASTIGSIISMECCEVSELSCKHFFHKDCLEKWFENRHINNCPLCRSLE
ncbi:hypothetical protein I3760_06G066700 [Carya illinoinensis]|nr:hypothetical protein I3760_06G066700 [Carya illinoinensis]